MFIQDQSEKHIKSVSCVTFDQPLWLKATKIIEETGLPIVCRLGFPTFISFFGSMGTMMKGSGLAESLETVYGEPTVRQMFAAKAISRTLRGHFLVEAVLIKKLLRHIFPTDYSYFPEVDKLLTDEEQETRTVCVILSSPKMMIYQMHFLMILQMRLSSKKQISSKLKSSMNRLYQKITQ